MFARVCARTRTSSRRIEARKCELDDKERNHDLPFVSFEQRLRDGSAEKSEKKNPRLPRASQDLHHLEDIHRSVDGAF